MDSSVFSRETLGIRSALGGDDDPRAWSVTPTVTWAASVHAGLPARRAEFDATRAAREQTVLLAIEETGSAFMANAKEQAALKSLTEQARASPHASELADFQYRAGVTDFLIAMPRKWLQHR